MYDVVSGAATFRLTAPPAAERTAVSLPASPPGASPDTGREPNASATYGTATVRSSPRSAMVRAILSTRS